MPEVIEQNGEMVKTKQSLEITQTAQEVNRLLLRIADRTIQPHVREKCKEMFYFLSQEYPILGFCKTCDSFPKA